MYGYAVLPRMTLVTGVHAEGRSCVGGTSPTKRCRWVSFQNQEWHLFLRFLLRPELCCKNGLRRTGGLHRGVDRCLSSGQTGLEVLVRIQTVCFVDVLASGLKELWEMGR